VWGGQSHDSGLESALLTNSYIFSSDGLTSRDIHASYKLLIAFSVN